MMKIVILLLIFVYRIEPRKFRHGSHRGYRAPQENEKAREHPNSVLMPDILDYLQTNKTHRRFHKYRPSHRTTKKSEWLNIPENPAASSIVKYKEYKSHHLKQLSDNMEGITSSIDHISSSKSSKNVFIPTVNKDNSSLEIPFITEKIVTVLTDSQKRKQGKFRHPTHRKGKINLSGWANKNPIKPDVHTLKLHEINFPALIRHILNKQLVERKINKATVTSGRQTSNSTDKVEAKKRQIHADHKSSRLHLLDDGDKNNEVTLIRDLVLSHHRYNEDNARQIANNRDEVNHLEEEGRRIINLKNEGKTLETLGSKKYNFPTNKIIITKNTARDIIPRPNKNISSKKRTMIFSSLSSTNLPQQFPSQYPEMLNLQPMNDLYSQVQGLDPSEQDFVGGVLKNERVEEENLKKAGSDKMVLTDYDGNLYQGETPKSDGQESIKSRSEKIKEKIKQKEKVLLDMLRNEVKKKKEAKMKKLKEKLLTLRRLQESRRKHEMVTSPPASLASESNDSVNSQLKYRAEVVKQKNHKVPVTNTSGFQDALYDRGNFVRYRNFVGTKKQLSNFKYPVPPIGYFHLDHKHIRKYSDDATNHVTSNKTTLLDEQMYFRKSNKLKTEAGRIRQMNEFTFNGIVKLDPNGQNNVKFVHGTPPAEFVEAFATMFPPTRKTTPFGPGFTLPVGHATMGPSLPTFRNGYPWSWYKNKISPTVSRYRNDHAHFTTRRPTKGPTKTVKQTGKMKTSIRLPTNTQQLRTKPKPTIANALPYNYNIPSNINTEPSIEILIPTVAVDGDNSTTNASTTPAMLVKTTSTTPSPVATTTSSTTTTLSPITSILTTETTTSTPVTTLKTTTPQPAETTMNTAKVNAKNESYTKTKGTSKRPPIAYVTYDKNARILPNDAILDPKEEQDFETKQNIQLNPKLREYEGEGKINKAIHTPHPEYKSPMIRTPASTFSESMKAVIQKPYRVSEVTPTEAIIEKDGDKRAFQQFSSYTIKEIEEGETHQMENQQNQQNIEPNELKLDTSLILNTEQNQINKPYVIPYERERTGKQIEDASSKEHMESNTNQLKFMNPVEDIVMDRNENNDDRVLQKTDEKLAKFHQGDIFHLHSQVIGKEEATKMIDPQTTTTTTTNLPSSQTLPIIKIFTTSPPSLEYLKLTTTPVAKKPEITYPRIRIIKPVFSATTQPPSKEVLPANQKETLQINNTETASPVNYERPVENILPVTSSSITQTNFQPVIIGEPIISEPPAAKTTGSNELYVVSNQVVPFLTQKDKQVEPKLEKLKPELVAPMKPKEVSKIINNTQSQIKTVLEEEMNMDDMYWTDSVEEIEHACRQQKGTNLIVNILAFGDSLTRGYYNKGRNHHPYTMKLQYLLNKMDAKRCFIVENEGRDGDIAFGEMPKRMEEVLNDIKKPFEWVIILGGTNDIYNKKHAGRHTAEELTQNILSLHHSAHQHGSKTVVVTIPEVLCESNEMCQDMKQIRDIVNNNLRTYALEHKGDVLLCDLAGSLARNKIGQKLMGQFFEGGLHLKPRGYETMARLIFDSIKQTLD